jgi:hypothetical protein
MTTTVDATTTSAWARVRPAQAPTYRQLPYLMDLLSSRESEEAARPFLDQYETAVRTGNLSRTVVSGLIDALRRIPVRTVARQQTADRQPAAQEVEAGFYTTSPSVGVVTVWKVQEARHGSGRLYAKVLRETGDADSEGRPTWHFEYQPGAIALVARGLRNGDVVKLTVERAQEIGHLYGICCICAATLTDEESIAAGIGPVCVRRFGITRREFAARQGATPEVSTAQVERATYDNGTRVEIITPRPVRQVRPMTYVTPPAAPARTLPVSEINSKEVQ